MKKRMICILCLCAMLVAIFAGCAAKQEHAPVSADTQQTSEASGAETSTEAGNESGLAYVEMDWFTNEIYERPDGQMIVDKLNEYLLEKLNLKLNVISVPYTEYEEKLYTMLQAGEPIGVCQLLGNYYTAAAQGLYYPMDDLLNNYGVGSKALFSDTVWDSMKVDGKIYGVPTLKDNAYIMSFIYNKDLADELGLDMENPQWKTTRNMEEILMQAKNLRDEKHPEWANLPLTANLVSQLCPSMFSLESFLGRDYLYAVCNVPGLDDIEGYDNDTVFNLYETEEYKEYCLMMQRLVSNGVCAYDYTELSNISYEPSTLITSPGWGYTWIDDHMFSNDFVTKLHIFEDEIWTDSTNFSSCGYGIPANCPDPERAMMFIELMNTDSYAATLLRFGIEGEHYLINDEGKMVLEGSPRNSDPSNLGYVNWYGADYGNLTIVNAPESYAGPDGYMFDKLLEYNNNAKLAAHMGLVIDTTDFINELAACNSVVTEFDTNLSAGKYDSPEAVLAAIEAFNEKLKANGMDKVIEGIQAQVDAFNAAR